MRRRRRRSLSLRLEVPHPQHDRHTLRVAQAAPMDYLLDRPAAAGTIVPVPVERAKVAAWAVHPVSLACRTGLRQRRTARSDTVSRAE
jgi:hypothetical protein